jgi:pyridinium-3,5-bisthiocarboxylic acid mononucleotide nickel chelatase
MRGVADQPIRRRRPNGSSIVRIAYFDCFAGASGNMILGALVDAGLSLDALERELRRLPVSGWTMSARPVQKRGLGALYLDVSVPGEDHDHDHHDDPDHAGHAAGAAHHEHGPHRTLADVLAVIRAGALPEAVEKTARAIFHRLGEAEARVHRIPVNEIAFHEVGQIDAIVDIVGAALGLYMLDIEQAYCSPLPCGRGTIHSAHGSLPSPAPATMELLRGAPTYDVDVDGELVTPTGAAILTTVATFAPRPPMTIRAVGYGSGRSDFPFANVLRVIIGDVTETSNASSGASPDAVEQIETNIDDMNPQAYEHVFERLFAAGALDVWTTPAHMKKGRPGILLTALAPAERAEAVIASLLSETTSIGVRRWTARRAVNPRSIHTIETEIGAMRVKVVQTPAGPRARPEYDDVKAIAQRDGAALVDVMRKAERAADEWLAANAPSVVADA